MSLLCAISVFSASLWLSKQEPKKTQRAQRWHREVPKKAIDLNFVLCSFCFVFRLFKVQSTKRKNHSVREGAGIPNLSAHRTSVFPKVAEYAKKCHQINPDDFHFGRTELIRQFRPETSAAKEHNAPTWNRRWH